MAATKRTLTLVFDKGNNSQDNFAALRSDVQWVGSLTPSHYDDLMKLSLDAYEGQWDDCHYHRCRREVMGVDCALVLTYNEKARTHLGKHTPRTKETDSR